MIYVLIVLSLIIIFLLIYYFGEGKGDLKKANPEFKIPGLSDGFVPQGMCYIKDLNSFLISGYMGDHRSASRIYVIDSESKKLIKFVYVIRNYKQVVSHFGGITSFGKDVWISTEKEVLRIKVDDIKNAKTGSGVNVFDSFSPKNNADFCFVHSGLLWIGEFYKLGKFKTDISHHIKINNKTQFHAMCYGFKISSQGECGIEKPIPVKAMSIPDLAQGICVCENKLFLSASYGIAKSSLYVYENVLNKNEESYTFFKNKKIPLHILSRDKLIKKYVLPSMSEEVECYNKKVYVLFENSAKKYKIFTRKKIKKVFSIFMNKG